MTGNSTRTQESVSEGKDMEEPLASSLEGPNYSKVTATDGLGGKYEYQQPTNASAFPTPEPSQDMAGDDDVRGLIKRLERWASHELDGQVLKGLPWALKSDLSEAAKALRPTPAIAPSDKAVEAAARALCEHNFENDPERFLPWRDLSDAGRNGYCVDAHVALTASYAIDRAPATVSEGELLNIACDAYKGERHMVDRGAMKAAVVAMCAVLSRSVSVTDDAHEVVVDALKDCRATFEAMLMPPSILTASWEALIIPTHKLVVAALLAFSKDG